MLLFFLLFHEEPPPSPPFSNNLLLFLLFTSFVSRLSICSIQSYHNLRTVWYSCLSLLKHFSISSISVALTSFHQENSLSYFRYWKTINVNSWRLHFRGIKRDELWIEYFYAFHQKLKQITAETKRLQEQEKDLEQQQATLTNQVDQDRCRLELVYLTCLIAANKAKYDLTEFKRDNFGTPVSFKFILFKSDKWNIKYFI
jgi:hypothetical protein